MRLTRAVLPCLETFFRLLYGIVDFGDTIRSMYKIKMSIGIRVRLSSGSSVRRALRGVCVARQLAALAGVSRLIGDRACTARAFHLPS